MWEYTCFLFYDQGSLGKLQSRLSMITLYGGVSQHILLWTLLISILYSHVIQFKFNFKCWGWGNYVFVYIFSILFWNICPHLSWKTCFFLQLLVKWGIYILLILQTLNLFDMLVCMFLITVHYKCIGISLLVDNLILQDSN